MANLETAEPRGVVRVLASPAFTVHQLAKHLPRLRAHTQAHHRAHRAEQRGGGGRQPRHLHPHPQAAAADGQLRRATAGALRNDHLRHAGLSRPPRSPREPKELFGHEWLLPFSPDGNKQTTFEPCPLRSAIHRAAGEKGRKPVTLEQPPMALIHRALGHAYHAALADMGITALPSFVVEDALRSGRIERVLPNGAS